MTKIFNILLISILSFTLLNNTYAQVGYEFNSDEDFMTITNHSYDIMDSNEISFFKDGKIPVKYNSLNELLKNEKNVKYVTDGCNNGFIAEGGDVAMTMMYCEDIYGENGKEIWERTDTRINILGDNSNYIQKELFIKLYNNKNIESKLNDLLKDKSEKQIQNISIKIDRLIETTKMTRIAKFIQDKKITELLFVKEKLNEFLLK